MKIDGGGVRTHALEGGSSERKGKHPSEKPFDHQSERPRERKASPRAEKRAPGNKAPTGD
jgi:hypothetical protein